MKYLKIKIKAIQPIKTSSGLNSTGTSRFLSYIPGSLIRGAFIKNYMILNKCTDILKNEESRSWFFENKLEFLNGYISNDDNERSYPMPQGLFAESTEILKYENEESINVKNKLIVDIEDTDKKFPSNDYIFINDTEAETVSVKSNFNLHIKKGKEKEKKVFRYEAIKEEQEFISYIKCNLEDEDIEKVKKIINNGEFYIGGSKGSGYGNVEISIKGEYESNPEVIYEDNDFENHFIIYTLSDGIFLDESGVLKGYIDEEYLKEKLNLSQVKLEDYVTDTVIVGGYNNKWNCRLPQYEANKAGSLYKYSFSGEIKEEDLINLMNEGVGIRTEEGFGRIMVLSEIPIETIKKKSKEDTYCEDNSYTLDDKEKKQIQFIVDQICKNKIEEIMQKIIVSNYKKDKKVNKNQIGKLVQVFNLAQSKSKKEGKEFIKEYLKHLSERPEGTERINKDALNQLNNLKIGNLTSVEYIKRELNSLDDSKNFYNQYNLHDIEIAEIKPNLDENEIYFYKMLELENTFRYILRMEGIKNGTKK